METIEEQLDRLLKEHKEKETKLEKFWNFIYYDCNICVIKRHIVDLYYNLHPRKLKQLCQMVKFWYRYDDFTSHKGLEFLYWHLKNVLEVSKENIIYENQEQYNEDLENFIECLRIEIEEDFGDISDIGFEKYIENSNNNESKMLELFKQHHRWGI